MSIRMLTDRLREEFLEVGRSRKFDATRPRAVKSQSASPSSAPPSSRQTVPSSPISIRRDNVSSSPRVGLRTRDQENPWGIPGGIASRFGRGALAQMRAEEEAETAQIEQRQIPEETEEDIEVQTQAETPQDTAETDRPTEDASEREAEKDEAARITIELQSH